MTSILNAMNYSKEMLEKEKMKSKLVDKSKMVKDLVGDEHGLDDQYMFADLESDVDGPSSDMMFDEANNLDYGWFFLSS